MNKWKPLTVDNHIEHQQRLERVLSVFEKIEDDTIKLTYYEWGGGIQNYGWKIKKYLDDTNFVINGRCSFSLETVESLLKDLGVLK